MADWSGCEILTDAAWAVWEPLIEQVRPRGRTPPKELRRTISAIFWRHQNGAKWRSIPARARALVAGRAALHPLGEAGRLGASARSRSAARHCAWHDLPRWHQHPGAPQGGGRGKKGIDSQERDVREALG